MKITFVLVFWAASLIHSMALAGGYVRPTVMYISESSEKTDKTKTTRTMLDMAAGYMHDSTGLMIGAMYATEHRKTETTTVNTAAGTSTTTNTDGDRLSMGPTVGWTSPGQSGPYIMGTYFYTSELTGTTSDIFAGSSTSKISGSGFEGDVGVRFAFKTVFLAFQLSYKQFEYKRTTASTNGDSGDLTPPFKETYIDPYFAVWIQF